MKAKMGVGESVGEPEFMWAESLEKEINKSH